MALARLVTFVPLTLIKSADVNGEFNNILNNPIALISPTTGAINFNLQAHTNLLPSVITASSATAGQALIATSSGGTVFGTPSAGNSALPSRVRNLQAVASSQNVQFNADEYLLRTTANTNSFTLASTVAFTVNLNTAGPAANGRDQAGAFASTYIHYYAISTGLNSTVPAGIVSSQPPPVGPTMPTSYSAWAYLYTALYSSSSTTLVSAHRVRGSRVWNDTVQNVLNAGQSTVSASIPTGATVPTYAQNMMFNVIINNQAGGGASTASLQSVLSGASAVNFTGISGFPYSAYVEYPNTALFYVWSTNPNPGGLTLNLAGYSVPNGDAA